MFKDVWRTSWNGWDSLFFPTTVACQRVKSSTSWSRRSGMKLPLHQELVCNFSIPNFQSSWLQLPSVLPSKTTQFWAKNTNFQPPTLNSKSRPCFSANFLSHRVVLPPTRPVPPTTSALQSAAPRAVRGGARGRFREAADGEDTEWPTRQGPWGAARCMANMKMVVPQKKLGAMEVCWQGMWHWTVGFLWEMEKLLAKKMQKGYWIKMLVNPKMLPRRVGSLRKVGSLPMESATRPSSPSWSGECLGPEQLPYSRQWTWTVWCGIHDGSFLDPKNQPEAAFCPQPPRPFRTLWGWKVAKKNGATAI